MKEGKKPPSPEELQAELAKQREQEFSVKLEAYKRQHEETNERVHQFEEFMKAESKREIENRTKL